MTYLTVSALRQDSWVRDRVAACVALEKVEGDPTRWALDHDWELATQPGWATAWEASTSDTPGTDPEAITDSMILSAVQAITAAETPPDA